MQFFQRPRYMTTTSSAYNFPQGHPVLHSWEGTSSTLMNNRGLGKSLGGHILSYWILHSGWNQHTPCFKNYTCFVWDVPTTSQRLRMTRLFTRSNDFRDQRRPCTMSYWWHGTSTSCSWRMMNMASVVPLPGMKPNCMSSMRTYCHKKPSASGLVPSWSS